MLLLCLGLFCLLSLHLVPAMPNLRAGLVTRFGELPYKALFSLGALAGLALMIIGYRHALTVQLWPVPASWRQLPLVTMPGDLLVGRFTQAFYRKMGVEDLVVHSPAEYVGKAVQVATDRDYRKHVTARIAQASDVLFNDLEAVREHERFFEEALSHATY